MPVLMPVLTPQMKGQVMIKANQGQGESLREEETNTDEDREMEVSEESELGKALAACPNKGSKVKGKTPKMG